VRQRADLERHAKPVTRVVARAADLGVIPRTAEVARAPFRICLEASAAEHDGASGELAEAVRILHDHAGHPRPRILEQPDGGGAIADFDVALLGDLEPHGREADALVPGADDGAGRPLDGVANAHATQRQRRLHGDALRGHPADRVEGAADQDLAELAVRAAFGHA
jgi:hypothetical protein